MLTTQGQKGRKRLAVLGPAGGVAHGRQHPIHQQRGCKECEETKTSAAAEPLLELDDSESRCFVLCLWESSN